ncbi:hypothetical protein [Hymenobacter persicinus]|uniref:Uncharacterized protein n=1 Tax=Hymenobacter persicinus TaxID=2025506 RepID=A0A4Q5LFI5_9BACT|nr:hypothetical protein [Hymenobacter persicinus]RYU82101.1 hypothetical protein EWM57_04780 [Hymenobacter persicinus]
MSEPIYDLRNVDPVDLEALFDKIGQSFDINFVDGELAHLTTFGGFCDYVTSKISLDYTNHTNSCTSQQAFYKFRAALGQAVSIDSRTISPTTQLADVLPSRSTRQAIKKAEHYLGFEINLVGPPEWVTILLVLSIPVSLIVCFADAKVGLLGVLLAIIGLKAAVRFGSTLQLRTVGQVAEKISQEHYIHARRDPKTFNREEVVKMLVALFSLDLGLDDYDLTRDAKFN